MKKLFALVVMVVFLMVGCATGVSRCKLCSIDYGPYPDNYKELIKETFNARLFDPYSAVYTFAEPCKGLVRRIPVIGVRNPGWIICGTLNAKNRMGGYTGAKTFYVFIRNGRVRSATLEEASKD